MTNPLPHFFDLAPDALAILRTDGSIIRVNAAFERLLATTRHDAAGRPWTDLLAVGDRPDAHAALAGVHARPTVALRTRCAHADAAPWVDWHLALDSGNGLVYVSGREGSAPPETDERQRLESVGRLAGGIAHDFNNILTTILGATDFLAGALGADHPAGADVERIRSAAARAADLTRKLLAFSRQHVSAPRVVDPNAIVREMADLIRRVVGEGVRVELALDGETGRVRVDPAQLRQVLVDLVLNARDAMPDGGVLTIRTAPLDSPGRAGVRIDVEDTGTGMPDGVLARIFEPFFTTKEQGRGTGLSLSVAWGIIEQSDGTIEARSEPGRGTTVTILLPEAEGAAEAKTGPAGAPGPGARTILLVEDDDAVRDWLERVLRNAGFEVVAAAHPHGAIELAAASAAPIDLLVTDLTMPGMSGRELHERLAADGRVGRVLYVSGHTDDAALRREIARGGVSFLEKPFAADELVRTIRELLAGG